MEPGDSRAESYCLQGLNDELQGKIFPISANLTVGRTVSADIFLPDPSISRHHCRIDQSPAGFVLVSCSRRGGLKVNDQETEVRLLEQGDVISLGRFRLRVISQEHRPTPTLTCRPIKQRIDEDPEFATTELTGAEVLSARLSGDGQSDGLPGLGERLLAKARGIASASGGTLIAHHPLCWHIVWDRAGNIDHAPEGMGLRSALAVHRLAYLLGSADRARAVVGIARGAVSTAVGANESRLLWGPAVDRSLRLALTGSPGTTLIEPAEQSPAIPLALLAGSATGPDACPVAGFRLFGAGRRCKWVTAITARLSRLADRQDVLIALVAHDPQNDKGMVNLLCRQPLEVGEEYELSTASGRLILACRSSQPIEPAGHRAQFSGFFSADMFSRVLGFTTHDRGSSPAAFHAAA